ncbi:hypothetical protein ACQ86N_32060 [Puia sp. P3]|uniref:hypothetical protein n=1 Tax=Puia sp. P3 TaxID=3423952 RepID=UPI003D6690D6
MRNNGDRIPLSTSLGDVDAIRLSARRGAPVNKRVFYLSVQVIVNAIVIGLIAKGLVYLISLITNLSFYGRFSVAEASPAGNQLGVLVILVPIVGAVIVGFMARYGSRAIGGMVSPKRWRRSY